MSRFIGCGLVVASGLLASTAARADCQPSHPGNGQTVTCTGTAPTGFQADPGVDDLTINVIPGAIVQDSGGVAILANDGNTITNAGAITAAMVGIGAQNSNVILNSDSILVGPGGSGIALAGDDNVVINAGTITGGDSSIGIAGVSSNDAITNNGVITIADATSVGVGIAAGADSRVTNNNAIITGDDTIGIAGVGPNDTIVNNGTITTGAAVFNFAVGILAGPDNTIINNGGIDVGNDASGIRSVAGSTHIVNNGHITAGAAVFDFAAGIDLSSSSDNVVINNGKITVGAGSVGILTGVSNQITNNGAVVAGADGFSIGGMVACGCGILAFDNIVVNNGTLNGALNLIGDGNTLTNAGLITITNSGTPVGAIHEVDDTFIQTATGVLALRVNAAGASDQLQTFSAFLAGTLRAVVQPGLYGPATTYDGVVVACTCTGLNGTMFDKVTSSSAFFTAAATYDYVGASAPVFDPNVSLTLTRIPFDAVPGETQNQRTVGSVLEQAYSTTLTGKAATLFGNLLAAGSRGALDQISGEGTSGTQETAFGAADTFMTTMLQQGAFWLSGDTVDTDGVTHGAGPMGYAPDMAQASAFKAMAQLTPADVPPRWRTWASGFDGSWSLHGEASPGSAGLGHRTAGGAAGVDYQIGRDFLVGVAAGGSNARFSVADRGTSGSLEGAHIGVYGAVRWGQWYAAGTAAFSAFDNRTQRTIIGVGPTETASGSFGSDLFSGRFEAGYKQAFSRFSITPFAAVQIAALRQSGYTETSTVGGAPGVLGLTYGARTVTSVPTFLGAQFDTRVTLANGAIWSPYLRVSWVHEFEPTRAITASFLAIPGASFTVDGASAARDAARLDVGSTLALGRNAALFGSFDGEFSGRGRLYAGKAGLQVSW